MVPDTQLRIDRSAYDNLERIPPAGCNRFSKNAISLTKVWTIETIEHCGAHPLLRSAFWACGFSATLRHNLRTLKPKSSTAAAQLVQLQALLKGVRASNT
jgi:hypothetical protein